MKDHCVCRGKIYRIVERNEDAVLLERNNKMILDSIVKCTDVQAFTGRTIRSLIGNVRKGDCEITYRDKSKLRFCNKLGYIPDFKCLDIENIETILIDGSKKQSYSYHFESKDSSPSFLSDRSAFSEAVGGLPEFVPTYSFNGFDWSQKIGANVPIPEGKIDKLIIETPEFIQTTVFKK